MVQLFCVKAFLMDNVRHIIHVLALVAGSKAVAAVAKPADPTYFAYAAVTVTSH